MNAFLALLVLQDTTAVSPDVPEASVVGTLLSALVYVLGYLEPLIAGWITVPIVNKIKALSTLFDKAPAQVKQGVAAAIAGGLSWCAVQLDAQLPVDLFQFESPEVTAWVSAAIAYAIYRREKKG